MKVTFLSLFLFLGTMFSNVQSQNISGNVIDANTSTPLLGVSVSVKGTNIGAAIASVNSLEGPIILLAGGQGKGGNYKFFADSIHKKIKAIILFGEDSELIKKEFECRIPTICLSSLKDAIHYAHKQSIKGDKVLLSPACASFDQFDSYVHRGEEFCRIVREL